MDKNLDDSSNSTGNDVEAVAAALKPDVFYSIIATADIANMYIDNEIRKYGYHRTRFNIMYTLITHGGSMTPTEISKKIYRSKQTITAVVDGLEGDGLVRSRPVAGDRRIRMITITSKALDVVRETLPHRLQISHNAISCLKAEEVEQLNITLKKFRKHLSEKISESKAKYKAQRDMEHNKSALA